MSTPEPATAAADQFTRPVVHNLKTAAVLGIVGGATALLLVPYAVALSPGALEAVAMPLWLLAVLTFVQTTILTRSSCPQLEPIGVEL